MVCSKAPVIPLKESWVPASAASTEMATALTPASSILLAIDLPPENATSSMLDW
jgi:hypothetical protein